MTLTDSIRDLFLGHGLDKTYWVAYSGGLDSHVLLTVCSGLQSEYPVRLKAIHINHSLSPNAAAWAQHCARVCAAYGVELQTEVIQIDLTAGDSLEEEARKLRYQAFATQMADGDVLITAHHQDDQAETMLLQLLRGAGPKGLAAMPALKPFAAGWHARPFLAYSRAALEHYAHDKGLVWVDDESNRNIRLTRNFLRYQVMPLLQQRWPTAAQTIARSAAHCAEAHVILEESALELCEKVKGSRAGTLSVSGLLNLDAPRQRLALRTWIQSSGFAVPDTRKLGTICTSVLKAGWDKLPSVAWGNVILRRYRDDIFVMTKFNADPKEGCWRWNMQHSLELPEIGWLSATLQYGAGLRPDLTNVEVRFRRGGEVIHVPGRGHHTLKNMFHEWGVLPWERDRIPLFFIENRLIQVMGYFVDAEYLATSEQAGWVFELKTYPQS